MKPKDRIKALRGIDYALRTHYVQVTTENAAERGALVHKKEQYILALAQDGLISPEQMDIYDEKWMHGDIFFTPEIMVEDADALLIAAHDVGHTTTSTESFAWNELRSGDVNPRTIRITDMERFKIQILDKKPTSWLQRKVKEWFNLSYKKEITYNLTVGVDGNDITKIAVGDMYQFESGMIFTVLNRSLVGNKVKLSSTFSELEPITVLMAPAQMVFIANGYKDE